MQKKKGQQEKPGTYSSGDPGYEIRESAVFIADAHYPHHGEELSVVFDILESGKIRTSQLFLMGDIFDLLFGYSEYILEFTHPLVEKLRRLSRKMEICYLEGNHDFLLKDIFPGIHIVPRHLQPVTMRMGTDRVMLSHGDRYATGYVYDFYSRILRTQWMLSLLRPLEKWVIDRQISRLAKKDICKDFPGFRARAEEIMRRYPEDVSLVVEGHFHQGVRLGRYISLPSLACQKQVGIVRNGEIVFRGIGELLEEAEKA
jgi:UDP-2,3-diacylglucosamine hydrolase